ncbi:MAG: protein kinase [Anaerolineales bacterium]|nr:protein kinase [Anaerolineales bacterium]
MKQACLSCHRISPDSNLYCQETYCPAELSPYILDYGEWLGDIEIVKPVITLRSAVLYEATHKKELVFLKVAHPGEENKERLKREAEFLRTIKLQNKEHPLLPSLMPPYAETKIEDDAYGKAMLRGHLLYFYIFKHVAGEPLRDVLKKNPQLWINHVGWLMIELATAVNFLHASGFYHLGISPDVVLVRFDNEDPNVPRILLFDFGVISDAQNLGLHWHSFFITPAYTAPELLAQSAPRISHATDVYGLGLTLYELLVGEPPYPFKLYSDDEVYVAVKHNRRVQMNRVEDVKKVAQIALQATAADKAQRYQETAVFIHDLQQQFGKVPPPKPSRFTWFKKNLVVLITTALALAFLVALAGGYFAP